MATPASTITLTMRELDRRKTIQALADRMLRPVQAAVGLGLTVRQESDWRCAIAMKAPRAWSRASAVSYTRGFRSKRRAEGDAYGERCASGKRSPPRRRRPTEGSNSDAAFAHAQPRKPAR